MYNHTLIYILWTCMYVDTKTRAWKIDIHKLSSYRNIENYIVPRLRSFFDSRVCVCVCVSVQVFNPWKQCVGRLSSCFTHCPRVYTSLGMLPDRGAVSSSAHAVIRNSWCNSSSTCSALRRSTRLVWNRNLLYFRNHDSNDIVSSMAPPPPGSWVKRLSIRINCFIFAIDSVTVCQQIFFVCSGTAGVEILRVCPNTQHHNPPVDCS